VTTKTVPKRKFGLSCKNKPMLRGLYQFEWLLALVDEGHFWRTMGKDSLALLRAFESAYAVVVATGTPIYTSSIVSFFVFCFLFFVLFLFLFLFLFSLKGTWTNAHLTPTGPCQRSHHCRRRRLSARYCRRWSSWDGTTQAGCQSKSPRHQELSSQSQGERPGYH